MHTSSAPFPARLSGLVQESRHQMRIADVVTVPVASGFFRDDQAAIRAGAEPDNFAYHGAPLTPGFSQIREPGCAVSVLLRMTDGQFGPW